MWGVCTLGVEVEEEEEGSEGPGYQIYQRSLHVNAHPAPSQGVHSAGDQNAKQSGDIWKLPECSWQCTATHTDKATIDFRDLMILGWQQ